MNQLCPVRCADLRAVLEAVDRLKDLVSEMGECNYFDRKSGDLRRNGAYTEVSRAWSSWKMSRPNNSAGSNA